MKRARVAAFCIVLALCLNGCTEKQKHTDKSNRVSDGKVVSDVPQASGEGSPSTEQIDLTKSKEYKVGETINIASDGKEYELLIEKAEYTEKRDEYTQDPEYVVLITYTYRNYSNETLLIDDMRFQLMDSTQKELYESYYFAEIQIPQPLEKGEECTAQVAYAMEEKAQDFLLVYRDTVYSEIAPVKIMIDDIK